MDNVLRNENIIGEINWLIGLSLLSALDEII